MTTVVDNCKDLVNSTHDSVSRRAGGQWPALPREPTVWFLEAQRCEETQLVQDHGATGVVPPASPFVDASGQKELGRRSRAEAVSGLLPHGMEAQSHGAKTDCCSCAIRRLSTM
jgi:hypothetical protein